MYDTYDKCSKQMYDTVQQLMKLAEADNIDSFFKLAKANKSLFSSEYSLFETAVAAGLTARNKAEILDKFIADKSENFYSSNCEKILSHLAGILIREQRCREAVKRLISVISDDFSNKNYILLSAVMADDLEIFKLIYDKENDLDFIYYYKSSLLICGLFKSKKILDYITDNGNNFLKEKMPYDADFNEFINNFYDTLFNDPDIFSEKEKENDILFKWLQNIYSMYFSNEAPEASYKILMNIAKNTGLIADRDRNQAFYYSDYCFNTKKMIMREIYILLMCGHKINDLTFFIRLNLSFSSNTSECVDVLMKIAGDEPFITVVGNRGFIDLDFIVKLAEKLKGRLTVKLVSGFDLLHINSLRDKAKPKIDIENHETFEHISFLLKPINILDRTMLKVQRENQRELVRYLIGSGFVTVEKMTKTAASVNNTDILNMLFNYGNEKDNITQ